MQGYSTLEAGLRTLPFAIFAGVTAPIGARFALRWGPSGGHQRPPVMTAGLLLARTLDAGSAYFGPVIIMAARHGAVAGHRPRHRGGDELAAEEKAGAGAAVNDTTRELGGTLGVAVVGSVFARVYGADLVDSLAYRRA